MADAAEITALFWKELRADMTAMLGLDHETGPRPMTAQLDGTEDRGPIWFFGGNDNDLTQRIRAGRSQAYLTFVSKGHSIFASLDGTLAVSNDRAVIDRLWTPMVAAWYPDGGKDDPNLALLRFDPAEARLWRNTSGGVFAMIRGLLGGDPEGEAARNVAEVSLR